MTFVKALIPPNWSLLDIEDMRATLASKKQLCSKSKREGKGSQIRRR